MRLVTVTPIGLLLARASFAQGQCNIVRFQADAAKDVEDDLNDGRKWGCEYSGLDCVFTGGQYVQGTCALQKGAADRQDAASCNPQLLVRNLERDLASDVAKVRRKFGCQVDSLSCSGDGRRTTCVANQGAGAAGGAAGAAAGGGGYGHACDLSILTASVEHELMGKVVKAQARHGCPAIESVVCHVAPSTKWVDCDLAIGAEAAVPSMCNMNYLTQSISSDIGEELADAERKYGCPVPPYATCLPTAHGSSVFSCTLGEQGSAGGGTDAGHAGAAGNDAGVGGAENNHHADAHNQGGAPSSQDANTGGAPSTGGNGNLRRFHFRHTRRRGHGEM